MIKNVLGTEFKYEDDKMYKLNKQTKKWSCCNNIKPNPRGYIRININKKFYQLHRLIYKYHNENWDITDSSKNNQIDHIDINKSNNKIENLRVVNISQNLRNKNKFKNCSSKFIGVSWNKTGKKWKASISINSKNKHLGYYDTEEEAYEVYKIQYDEIMTV